MFKTRKFYVAGVKFHELKTVINKVKEDDTLVLVPEPDNNYDANAVKILYPGEDKDVMVGYVPQRISSEISGAIDAGLPITCHVVSITPSAKPWEQLMVEISEHEEIE